MTERQSPAPLRITAGLGSADDYHAYCDAGADEVFCGYVPEAWASRYGLALPLNRREVRYYPVQLGARSELLILADMAARRGVPVTLTFNSLHYIPEQYPLIADIMAQCVRDGFRAFIAADPALLIYLHEQGLDKVARLHVSGELGEVNRGVLAWAGQLGAARIILHRKVPLNDMAALIAWAKARPENTPQEYEAFALNEMCHFSGAFCHSLHCDELVHMCRLPYRLGGVSAPMDTELPERAADPAALGAGGCGLCALWRMRQAGVTHLKLVGRGNHPNLMRRDIAALRIAADLAAASETEAAYLRALRDALFPNGCSGSCYYPGETGRL